MRPRTYLGLETRERGHHMTCPVAAEWNGMSGVTEKCHVFGDG